jgi:hypothetical protein
MGTCFSQDEDAPAPRRGGGPGNHVIAGASGSGGHIQAARNQLKLDEIGGNGGIPNTAYQTNSNQNFYADNRRLSATNSHNVNALHSNVAIPISEDQIYTALYPYDARTEDDLSFSEGDHLVIIDNTRGAWWLARHLNPPPIGAREQGYIPSNYVAKFDSLDSKPWFLGQCPRANAERQLQTSLNQIGAFLIRESESRRGDYSLSVKDNDGVKHYRIRQLDGQKGFCIAPRCFFPTLDKMIAHYQAQCDGLCCQECATHKPFYKT